MLLIFVLINTIFLFVLLFRTLFQSEEKKYESIRNSEIAILGIAFTQYALTFKIPMFWIKILHYSLNS